MYLTHAAIDATLDAVASLSAPGTRLAMTYVPPGYAAAWIRALASLGARVIREQLQAQIEPAVLARELAARGFRVESDDAAPDWAVRHWPEREAARVRAFERLALAVRT